MDLLDSASSDSGMGWRLNASGILFISVRFSVSSWVRWSKLRFPQFHAGDPPLPVTPAPIHVSSCGSHLFLSGCDPSVQAPGGLVRFSYSLNRQLVIPVGTPFYNACLREYCECVSNCLDSFSYRPAYHLRAQVSCCPCTDCAGNPGGQQYQSDGVLSRHLRFQKHDFSLRCQPHRLREVLHHGGVVWGEGKLGCEGIVWQNFGCELD